VAEITSYRPDDRRAVDALYRRVFGNDAAEASRLRWQWQYGRNPNNPGREPEIWIAREGKAIVGQYATMPVQVSVKGEQVRGSWGMDVMVAPEGSVRGSASCSGRGIAPRGRGLGPVCRSRLIDFPVFDGQT
jgi:hypothetical protein